MNKQEREALLVHLAGRLRDVDSWCGETHLQKAVFFLQSMTGVPFDYDYMLYKHGPFAFDLRDEIREQIGYGVLEIEAQSPPYGPRLRPTEDDEDFAGAEGEAVSDYEREIAFVVEVVGDAGAARLEKLGTALWYVVHGNGATLAGRAEKIHGRKPHISVEEAKEALNQIEELRQTWANQA